MMITGFSTYLIESLDVDKLKHLEHDEVTMVSHIVRHNEHTGKTEVKNGKALMMLNTFKNRN